MKIFQALTDSTHLFELRARKPLISAATPHIPTPHALPNSQITHLKNESKPKTVVSNSSISPTSIFSASRPLSLEFKDVNFSYGITDKIGEEGVLLVTGKGKRNVWMS